MIQEGKKKKSKKKSTCCCKGRSWILVGSRAGCILKHANPLVTNSISLQSTKSHHCLLVTEISLSFVSLGVLKILHYHVYAISIFNWSFLHLKVWSEAEKFSSKQQLRVYTRKALQSVSRAIEVDKKIVYACLLCLVPFLLPWKCSMLSEPMFLRWHSIVWVKLPLVKQIPQKPCQSHGLLVLPLQCGYCGAIRCSL